MGENTKEVSRIVASDAEDGVAVITVTMMPHPLTQNDFICQLICVRSFRNGGMGIDGEPDKDKGADDCSQDEEISCSLLPHRNLPSIPKESKSTIYNKYYFLSKKTLN